MEEYEDTLQATRQIVSLARDARIQVVTFDANDAALLFRQRYQSIFVSPTKEVFERLVDEATRDSFEEVISLLVQALDRRLGLYLEEFGEDIEEVEEAGYGKVIDFNEWKAERERKRQRNDP